MCVTVGKRTGFEFQLVQIFLYSVTFIFAQASIHTSSQSIVTIFAYFGCGMISSWIWYLKLRECGACLCTIIVH